MGIMKNGTVLFKTDISIVAAATIAGKMEHQGPLAPYYDVEIDDLWGEESWEKAEKKMLERAVILAAKKAELELSQIDIMMGGDLLNQIVSANYAARELDIPFLGLYGACSTMAESLSLGSMLIGGGMVSTVACVSGSHFDTAERQYRYPLEYGCQRPPTSQRTVTGSGAAILGTNGKGPYITAATIGRVHDMGVKDANNMGAAMAMAALQTIKTHLDELNRHGYYDVIATGDLGQHGLDLVKEKGQEMGLDTSIIVDCGMLVYDLENQDVDSGGSGCGCSAIVLNGYFMDKLKKREINRMLLVGTGALLSPTTTLQGESIPGIAHAVAIENKG